MLLFGFFTKKYFIHKVNSMSLKNSRLLHTLISILNLHFYCLNRTAFKFISVRLKFRHWRVTLSVPYPCILRKSYKKKFTRQILAHLKNFPWINLNLLYFGKANLAIILE